MKFEHKKIGVYCDGGQAQNAYKVISSEDIQNPTEQSPWHHSLSCHCQAKGCFQWK